MTRSLCITLGLFLAVAPAWGRPLIGEIEFSGRDSRGGPSTPTPLAVTTDKDGNTLYAGRTLPAWVGDLKDKDVLICEEAIEVIAQIGRPAKSATAELRRLLKADNRNLRIRAALAVWKVGGDPKGVPEILAEGLKDASSAVRREALVALGTLGSDAAVATSAIVDILDDPDPNLRNQAATTLQQLGPAALPALFESLKSNLSVVRQNTLLHLGNYMVGHLSKEHLPPLTARLRDDTLRCRVEAARILWAMGQAGAPVLAALEEGVKAPGGDLQAIIVQTLLSATEKPKALVPMLQVCLDGTNVYVRVQAARVLFEVEKKPQRVVPLYLEILRDPGNQHQGYVNYVIAALVDLKADAAPALPRLIELMKTPNYYVSYEARTVLANIGTPAVAPLVEIVESSTLPPGSQAYEIAISALGNLGAPAAKAVLPLLSRRDENVRVRAIRVVAGLGTHAKDAVPALIEATQDRSMVVRDAALQALGSLGELARAAVPRLVEMAKDRDVNLRLLCLRTLASIRPETRDIVPLCLPLLRDPNAPIRQAGLQLLCSVAPEHKAVLPAALKMLDDPATRPTALSILGDMGAGGARAVPHVAKLLADPHEDTRQSAAYALNRIGPGARAAAPALLDLLQSQNASTASAAASALLSIEPDAKASLPKLLAFLEKSRDHSAVTVLGLLTAYGKSAESAYPTVLAVLEDTTRTPQIRASAAVALSRIAPARAAKEALPPMRKLLAMPDQRLAAARAIFEADPTDKEAVDFFEAQLGHATPSVRTGACSALGQIGPAAKRFLPTLRELCKDKEYTLRAAAAMAAFHIAKDAKEALPTLEALLEDGTPNNISYGTYYLGELGVDAKGVLPKLHALRTGGDSASRINAAGAIRKIDKAVAAATPRKSPDPDENP